MSDANQFSALVERVTAELAQIHRAKHYLEWRSDNNRAIANELQSLIPFSAYRNLRIFTGDGGATLVSPPDFASWLINRILQKQSPEEILSAFHGEVERNSAEYTEVSPLLGVNLDEACDLEDGVSLLPPPTNLITQTTHYFSGFPESTAVLCQTFRVTPAFELQAAEQNAQAPSSKTAPNEEDRNFVRSRVRLACILASIGPVEAPYTRLHPNPASLFVAGSGNEAIRPQDARPIVPFPVKASAVKPYYARLKAFKAVDSLERAVDRLGRARLAASPVDRALELGIAAEIALMHDHSPANTEITFKIGTRAAWLLEEAVAERLKVMEQAKHLYQARSQAVHSGVLSSKSRIDLDEADRLVARVLLAIVERGEFPHWASLILGG